MVRTPKPAREIVVVGRSCRLPGASNVTDLWSNLVAGRCSVSAIPGDRWSLAKFHHPRPKEPGKAYIWSAGILEDIWSFDPTVFGISPREAEQMDPQQRLLLELTWEAFEDAGIRRSDVAGTNVGVFVGASSPEYSNIRNTDLASGDGYTATGGALSITSNRISHAFDLQGPSFTVDTACSSSLVALHQAMEALRGGRIDTAVVGGVNLLLSPFGFIVFSQASMLSPTGRCHSFDSRADGYVRAEGGVVLVLKTRERAVKDNARVYARLAASGVNSDGRTNGIALPSRFSQAKLLREVYAGAGIEMADVAFVEAHGTGTRVGDPIEASTIGEVLGRGRSEPLPIGSIKSNIGHLEPASGLAGVLKAMLALEHDLLPPSVNYDQPNPDIPFGDLNLAVCASSIELQRDGRTRYAGVNSFGFGGTNAHVVIADPPAVSGLTKAHARPTDLFAISGASQQAVRDLARRYGERLASASPDEAQDVAATAAHRREPLGERVVIEWRSPRDLVRKLERVADKEDEIPGATWGTTAEPDAPVAFVFSGNGGQWPGMGREAYAASRAFREAFDEIDTLFDRQFGWSITEAMFAEDLEQRLPFTHIAQPLIFAIQVATARALAAEGLSPSFVLGHSVGEIAAATVAGALSPRDAVRVIYARSHHQELARDTGRMGVVVGSREQVEELAAEFGVDVAAYNSPRTFTLAGPTDALKALGAAARKRRIVYRQLDLDYPFHCGLVDGVRDPLLRDLAGLKVSAPKLTMVSTVTGEIVGSDLPLDGTYWWRNVREPVRFSSALEAASREGARVFVEIGPRSVLLSNINETLEPTSVPFSAQGVLERRDTGSGEHDPIRPAVIQAFARGAAIDSEKLFGPPPSRPVSAPTYPWQHRSFKVVPTPEAVGFVLDPRWHRLIGARHTADGTEWNSLLDTTLAPELADHEVGGQAILPAAAFIEIGLAVARDWLECDTPALLDLEIVQPLALERDRAREVRARVSPTTDTIEILSRQRLSRGGWQLHATAKVARGTDEPIAVPDMGAGEDVAPATVYAAAEAVGLNYGPAFRLLAGVRIDETAPAGVRLEVELAPSVPEADYLIDPARLDACFHGLFVLFARLKAGRRGTAYLPVRFGHVRVLRAGSLPQRAMIDIRSAGDRAIVADFTLVDREGHVVASLVESRFQAARVKRAAYLEDRALVLGSVPIDGGAIAASGAGADVPAVLAAAATRLAAEDDETEEQLLLEGWATAAGYEIARAVADGETLTSERLDRLSPHVAAWLRHLLVTLEPAELAVGAGGGWELAATSAMPSAASILRTIVAENPNRATEILLASGFSSALSDAAPGDGFDPSPSASTLDNHELGGTALRAAGDVLAALVQEARLLKVSGRAVRILQIGYGPLSAALAATANGIGARVTILETDSRRAERCRLAFGSAQNLLVIEDPADLAAGGYDVVLAAERLHRLPDAFGLLELRGVIAPSGQLVAVEPLPSAFRDLVHGLSPGWFASGSTPDFPVGPLRSEGEWASALTAAGFHDASTCRIGTGRETATLIVAAVPDHREATEALAPPITIMTAGADRSRRLGQSLAEELAGAGHAVLQGDAVGAPLSEAGIHLFVAADPSGRDDVRTLRDACLGLKAVAEQATEAGAELWLVASAGTARASEPAPVAAGLLAFARTLANEFPDLVVRRLAVADGVAAEALAAALDALLRVPQAETDLAIEADCCRVLRLAALDVVPSEDATPAEASRLERGAAGGLGNLTWTGIERRAPDAGEVEIEVAATGLNFRDVMWAMSLLPDEILEHGFAGPSLGLECAGHVVQVGPGVSGLAVGDRVIAFAPAAFSTHVTVPSAVAARIPDGIELEAAATVPVAFLTAYYGLVTLGSIGAGDWVLIHGAAGGVGLAAVQIAQWRGARIIATAGSRDKRALLRGLGVEHVLNSRSSAFADEIRHIAREGVDIVLNSLSGEAMERGLSVLKPFGRFIELGKRDYVANTRIGLRPFRRNLSYFGVDVDQLLSDRNRASSIFGEIVELLAAGVLRPLPYRVFGAGETLDAFRLMQQSGHIGKLVLRPPAEGSRAVANSDFAFRGDRTHLLTGAFGGFGLETALWLADQGVRHMVLVGRSGPASDDARTVVAGLRERGIAVLAEACDVADEGALRDLLGTIASRMPPLAGVMHAAMVLEDGLIANLTEDQLERVLTPKVKGALLLDRLTAGCELDYFMMFSSITTFVGNPGQGAYVAANGYLEGLAHRRRAEGRPALAIAWGAISDVGVLARQKGLAEALAKRVGVRAMPAREGLELMLQALSRQPSEPVMAIGSLDWSAARRLPALASPTYEALTRGGGTVDTAERSSIDLRALAASEEPEKVRRQVMDVIVEEIATVLRVPKADVSLAKKLGEIGLDSLMAIELATALQDRLELDSPPSGSVGALTVPALADTLISFVAAPASDEETRVTQALNERHGSAEIDVATLAPVLEAVSARSQELKGVLQ